MGVFLGPNVKPEDYNSRMYRGATGFFPVPLANEPSKDLTPSRSSPANWRSASACCSASRSTGYTRRLKRIYTNDRGELVKDDGVERFFLFANIDTHWPVPRRGAWREDKLVQELYCLPNESSIAAFEERCETLVSEVKKRYGEPKFEPAGSTSTRCCRRSATSPSSRYR